jgi:hypothetical protein
MAGPLAKIVAQIIVQGASIFTRAFFTAYQQALRSKIFMSVYYRYFRSVTYYQMRSPVDIQRQLQRQL